MIIICRFRSSVRSFVRCCCCSSSRIRMGEGKTQNFQDLWRKKDDTTKNKKKMIIHHDNDTISVSVSSSIGDDDSTVSNGSSSSSSNETRDDASSTATTCCSSSSNSTGALYDLSELMSELPIKRGLSQYYHGKSDSFTCLSRVRSIEDLAKKEEPYSGRKKMNRGSKNGLEAYRLYTLPRAVISKRTSRTPSLSNRASRRTSFMNSNMNRPPQIP